MGSLVSDTPAPCLLLIRILQTSRQSVIMSDKKIKLTYFNLRARAEPCRLLLAYGGIKYEDERIPPPWDPSSTWSTLKPTTPFGQLPVLNWDGVEVCQSMACARFIAREVGLAGNTSLEQAQADEVVDVIQDLINAWVKLYFAKDEAGLKKFGEGLFRLLLVSWRRSWRVVVDSILLVTTSPGQTLTSSCTSVIFPRKLTPTIPGLCLCTRELEQFLISRLGWTPDQKLICNKIQGQSNEESKHLQFIAFRIR